MRTFYVDTVPGGQQACIQCNQFETGDTWRFQLFYGGGRYDIPAGATVSITGQKSDGTAFNVPASVSDNTVLVTVTEQITAAAGRCIAELLIESDGAAIYSANFVIMVEPAAVQGELSTSTVPLSITDADGNVYVQSDLDVAAEALLERTAEDQYQQNLAAGVAKRVVEEYTGSTLAGTNQSVKSAIDGLKDSTPYVTPEMYGAVGDGVTDDAQAIQSAVNSGKHVFFGKKAYLVSSPITIQNKENFCLNSENASIVYSGNNYAFILQHVVNADLKFGTITAANGGCIKIVGTSSADFSQYLNISFIQFSASTNCIFADNTGNSWINEIRISKGRFYSGDYGVYLHHNSTNGITHWIFNEVGVEGVDCGFYFHTDSVAAGANKWISYSSFFNIRYVEASTIFKNLGAVKNILIVDAYGINAGQLNLTQDATAWTLLQSDGGAYVENGTLKKYGGNHWIDITSAFTFDTNKVTASSGFVAQYNLFTKQVMLGGNLTVNLASGYNDIATITGYNAPYYCGLPFVISDKYCGTHITGRNKIRVITTEAFTGNLIVGGSWVVQ